MADSTNYTSQVQHSGGHEQSSGLPQLNPDSFASQLFWLAVVFAALYLVIARSTLPRIREVLGKRESQIQHDIDAAEKAKQEAEEARSSYEAQLSSAKQQSADLLARTQRELEAYQASENAKLAETLDAITRDSQQRIEAQHREAMEEITPLVQELTGDISKRFLPKAPTKTQINKAMKAAGA